MEREELNPNHFDLAGVVVIVQIQVLKGHEMTKNS